jgi:hypothetical protein
MPLRWQKMTVVLMTLGMLLIGLIYLAHSDTKNFEAMIGGYKQLCSTAGYVCIGYILGNVGEHLKNVVAKIIPKKLQ